MSDENLVRPVLTTLLANGIGIHTVEPVAGGYVLSCSTVDRFGGARPYVVVFSPDHQGAGLALGIERARSERAQLVYVGVQTEVPDNCPTLSLPQFLARFGGPVESLLPLDASYGDHLVELAFNRLPAGMAGVASDLFEHYVAAGLQFLVGRHVLHYGRRRSGERVPDGIALVGLSYAQFDTKAAESGFNFEADTIRQFSSYARDFAERYENLGKPHSFVCATGRFNDDEAALARRAREMYTEAHVTLCTITATQLADAVAFFRQNLTLRQFVNWKRLLSEPVLLSSEIEKHARAAKRDGLSGGED